MQNIVIKERSINIMNNVESFLLEHMRKENFQSAVCDDFSFVDSLIDQTDLKRINEQEGDISK